MGHQIKIVENEEELSKAHSVRRRVFIEEQNVPEDKEWDRFDKFAFAKRYKNLVIQIIFEADDKVVGTGRVVFTKNGAKMGRVAVLEPYRDRGIGTRIVGFLLNEIKKRDEVRILANVQLQAKGFYDKVGFKPVGRPFLEAGIKHIRMVLDEK